MGPFLLKMKCFKKPQRSVWRMKSRSWWEEKEQKLAGSDGG